MNRLTIDATRYPLLPTPLTSSSTDAASTNFARILEEAIGDVRASLHQADRTSADALVGEASPHSAMIAIAKADLQFRLVTQTRNKLVGAYNELMNLRM